MDDGRATVEWRAGIRADGTPFEKGFGQKSRGSAAGAAGLRAERASRVIGRCDRAENTWIGV